VTWEQLCDLAKAFPEVSEDLWYRTPALKVRGKGFVRLKEDGKTAVFMLESVDEQETLIEARPKIYFITDHYRGHPYVLAHLDRLSADDVARLIERAIAFSGVGRPCHPARRRKPA